MWGYSARPKYMTVVAYKLQETARSHEEEFIRRYEFLFSRCLQLTKRKDVAEDLLHDGFVQFTINRPDLERIEDLDGYLCRLLRNLYYARLRLATWSPKNNLSLIDYDSAAMALRSRDFSSEIHAQQELLRICRYAFIRKETSKKACVLTLRYFHGYYPSEIGKVINGSGLLVRQLLFDARREVRAYLANPFEDKSDAIELPSELKKMSADISDAQFLTRLRQALFLNKNGHCIPSIELEALYENSKVLNATVLGHVVHCALCLDQINRLRGLPSLSERQAENGEGRETPPRKPGGNGGPPSSSISARASRSLAARKRETFEHVPQELRISVNGIELCGQSIRAALNELRLAVNLAEKVTFIEIYSELGVRLLFMDVEAFPDGPIEQMQRVNLSDGRTLEAVLKFTGSVPILEVTYNDPVLESNGLEESEPVCRRPVLVPRFEPRIEEVRPLREAFKDAFTWSEGVFAMLGRLFGFGQSPKAGWITAATAIILAIALLIYEVRPDVVSAAELLDRSMRSEQADAPTSNLILHRSLNLQEFVYPSANPISHHRIEVWQSPGKQLGIRRLFDDNNRLVAEERIEAGGTARVSDHGGEGKRGIGGSPASEQSLQSNDVWRLELSAASFSSLIGAPKDAHVEKAPNAYFVDYNRIKNQADPSIPTLLKATLTLDKSSLHAVEEKLIVQEGVVTREFRISEGSLLRLPAETVDPRIFDLSLSKSSEGPQPRFHRPNTIAIAQPAAAALLGLQVEALYRMSRIDPELENQVRVERTGDGHIRVQGIIDSDERKREIVSALSPILKFPAVRTDLQTVSEALKAQSRDHAEPVIAQEVEVTNGPIPVASVLARYFNQKWNQNVDSGSRGAPKEWIQDEIRKFSSNVLDASHRSYLHAVALRGLMAGLTPTQIDSLDSTHRAQWEALIQSHADAVVIETRTIRKELERVFFTSPIGQANGIGESVLNVESDSRQGRSAEVLFKMISENHAAILSAFTVSNKNPVVAVSETRGLRQSLINLEALAKKISNAGE
jgi:RNA polymerase sigma factor (sigma-70 family)